MPGALIKGVSSGVNALKAGIPLGIKLAKYFIDSRFRKTVTPVPGSVVYSDLWVAVEHSGIYVGNGQIANIVVDGVAEASVCLDGPGSFTSKSTLGRKIYVSSNAEGAVGHLAVAEGAQFHLGERSFYGLVFKNCHQFSTKCVNYAPSLDESPSFLRHLASIVPGETWEPTMLALKTAASKRLGATKWRLWDWENDLANNPPPEPDWHALREYFMNQPLNEESIAAIRAELAETAAYEAEIADEDIPQTIRSELNSFHQTLSDISEKYHATKDFLKANQGAGFSYAELMACDDDFSSLAKQMRDNASIVLLAKKMGRNHISEEKKRQGRIPQASRNEVHGTHPSDDLMRLLPSELVNLEDETLETLFYARLLEKNLLSYELSGNDLITGEKIDSLKKRTGPIVACLDSSGSMQGKPLIKAKALLLTIAGLLKKEQRSLHVLLFGGEGELREFSMLAENETAGLLKFLQQGFGGGTDFTTPLNRALSIIEAEKTYQKADILMISDGCCHLPDKFISHLNQKKAQLDCTVYSVLCAGIRFEDAFSDEVLTI